MLIKNNKKVLVFSVGLGVLIVLSGLFYYFVFKDNQNDDNQNDANQSVVASGPRFAGIELLSVADINKVEDPEKRFSTFISTAVDAKFIGNSSKAMEYYKAAALVENVEENYRKNTFVNVYNYAIEINDTESAEYFASIVGQEAIDQNEEYLNKVRELNGSE